MHRVPRSLASLLLAAACAACSSESAPSLTDGGASDAQVSGDAGAATDGGTSAGDASAADASSIVDQCDPVVQSGCNEPTSKCIVESSLPMGGTSCVEPGNDVGLNGACTGGDCRPGLACVRTSSAASACQQVCNFDTGAGCDSLGNEFECRKLTGTNWGMCLRLPPTCDYATQAPCASDRACQPYLRRTGTWEFRCKPAGTQAEGQSCGSSGGGDCGRGLVCVRSQTTGQAQCRRYCSTNADCQSPETCAGSVADPAFMYCAQ